MSKFSFLSRLEMAIAATLLAMIVVLVFTAAVMRCLGHPLIWSIDLAQLMFIWLCFLGATRATRDKSLIGIDMFITRLRPANRFALELIMTACILVFLILLAYHGYRLTMMNWQRQFGDSGISYAWVTAAVPVGSLLLAISFFGCVIDAFRRRRRGENALIYSRTEPALQEH